MKLVFNRLKRSIIFNQFFKDVYCGLKPHHNVTRPAGQISTRTSFPVPLIYLLTASLHTSFVTLPLCTRRSLGEFFFSFSRIIVPPSGQVKNNTCWLPTSCTHVKEQGCNRHALYFLILLKTHKFYSTCCIYTVNGLICTGGHISVFFLGLLEQ